MDILSNYLTGPRMHRLRTFGYALGRFQKLALYYKRQIHLTLGWLLCFMIHTLLFIKKLHNSWPQDDLE